MSNHQCPYCGKPTITDEVCTFCKRAIPIKTAGDILFDTLIRDLEELSFTADWRWYWYERAETLRDCDYKLYIKVMQKAREYNEYVRVRDRRIKEDDLRCRELYLRINAMRLEKMAKQKEKE